MTARADGTRSIAAAALVAALLAGTAPPACSGAREAGRRSATTDDARVTTLDGASARPLAGEPGRLALFVFVAEGCPIARAMSPEIERLGLDAMRQGVDVALVYPDRFSRPEEIRAHNRDFGLSLPTLLDPTHAIVDAVGATISPEAALVRFREAGGIDLVYRGRINDLYAAPGRRKPSATSHDLARALAAAIEGRTPEVSRTEAVGCIIEPLTDR